MPIWQLCANLLIPNCLRSNLSYSPLAALELYVKTTKSNNMKTQKFKILSLRMALLTILLSGLSMQNIYAFSETTKNLPLNGRWEVKARSLSPIPTASYDSQSIYIENPSPNCDITITITSSTGEEVYRQTFSESQTAYMVIRIGNLTSGQYTLQMANNQGNYLTGVFGI